jgi:hypothetical protein
VSTSTSFLQPTLTPPDGQPPHPDPVVGGADLFLVLCGGILRVYLHLGLPTHRMLPSAKGRIGPDAARVAVSALLCRENGQLKNFCVL